MGYELNAHNLPTFFVDPGTRDSFLPKYGNNCLDKMRLRTYEEFKNTLENALENQERYTYSQINRNKLCINSADVSNQIYKNLLCAHSKFLILIYLMWNKYKYL